MESSQRKQGLCQEIQSWKNHRFQQESWLLTGYRHRESNPCRFVLWKDNAFLKRLGKRMDAHVADKLLRDGRVRLKDCKSAKGKTYNATVLLGTEADGRSKFSLEFEGGC